MRSGGGSRLAPRDRAREGRAVRLRARLVLLWRDEPSRFAFLFAVIAGSLLAVYYFPRTNEDLLERWTASYLWLYTRAVGTILYVFDPHVTAHGNIVSGPFTMRIVKSCDAMEANILFASAILAIRAPWWRKGIALVAGLAALTACNLVRLVFLYWAGVYVSSAFDFLHYDVWPLVLVVFATLDFVLWMRWARGASAGRAEPPAIENGAVVG
jgi:exosortase/archaeosortase family protein